MKATKASVEFHETLPRPHALSSAAVDIQINQAGTRIRKDIQTSLVEVKSNLEKQKDCSKVGRSQLRRNLPEQ